MKSIIMEKYITSDGLEKLKKELHFLKTEKRKQVAKKIEKAVSYGDLSDSAEYSEAKEDQEFLENKISEIEELIRSAKIVSEKPKTKWVQVGSVVRTFSQGIEEKFQIVGEQEASPSEGKISVNSPIGSAFLNKPEGAIVAVHTPGGDIKYKILKIE